ncbi:hypothetical protein LWI28_028553 [Acer negundo]|uniref:SHSP domain-containing protein n=1 Tax=Acer negundo TaxID=4023 RepID=A0AAD5NR09_ACENE|nr:hypothetical protein LWI28_028553 [Acer negundo]
MENVRARKRGSGADRPVSHNPIVQDFVPSYGWTEDSNGHYLLVDLPDFKKEEVKLQVDDTSGHVTISGERLTSDNRNILRFEQTLTLPPDSDIDGILGKFESGIIYVTVPKLVTVQQEENRKNDNENDHGDGSNHVDEEEKKEKNSRVDDFPEETIKKWEDKEPSNQLVSLAMRMLKENKQIVFTALLAFSLGVWVSRKVGSCGHDIVDGAAI